MAVFAGCGMGFLATAILVLNNLRDIETDAAAGKRTLATRIGRDRTLVLLVVIVCAAFVVPIVILVLGLAGVTVMLVHFAIPVAAVPVRTAFASRGGPALVAALKRMAAAEIAYEYFTHDSPHQVDAAMALDLRNVLAGQAVRCRHDNRKRTIDLRARRWIDDLT